MLQLLIESKCIVSSWAVFIICLPPPLCARLCYLWLIYATLNLALIVNVQGETGEVWSSLCLRAVSQDLARLNPTVGLEQAPFPRQLFTSLTSWRSPPFACPTSIRDLERTYSAALTTGVIPEGFMERQGAAVWGRCWQETLGATTVQHPSLLANMETTWPGFVTIKPGLGLESQQEMQ